jgi:hypothetical protein
MSAEDTGLSGPTGRSAGAWNYEHLIVALVIAFILQSLFLPCLCQIGEAKTNFALVLDGLVLLRSGVARLRRETGSGWVFYVVLLYSSPLWIHLAALIVLGGH